MAHLPQRTFVDSPAKRERVPLIIGLSGPSGSGKTYSALELATGIQSVVGGDIFGVDTESKRMLHYADYFKFRHVPFSPPFGPLDYLVAFQHCISKGAKIIIADSMSHEHDGEGGVMDQVEEILDKKCGEDWEKRLSYNQVAHARVKPGRKVLNRYIKQMGDVIWILCYQAQDKIKPLKKGQKSPDGEKIIHLGWQPITTSPLVFDMTARFLFGPASEGRPTITPQEEAEKMMVKNPRQFSGWVQSGQQINRELGQKMARWAIGEDGAQAPKKQSATEVMGKLLALGAAEEDVLASLGVNHVSEITDEQVEELVVKGKAIKSGKQSVGDAFPSKKEEAPL